VNPLKSSAPREEFVMKNLTHRILMAYRPLYLRGLLMDGQYKVPDAEQKPPVKGSKVIHLVPAFEPRRTRVLHVTPAAAFIRLLARIARSVAGPSVKPIAKLHR
jgi:hypothetical protein